MDIRAPWTPTWRRTARRRCRRVPRRLVVLALSAFWGGAESHAIVGHDGEVPGPIVSTREGTDGARVVHSTTLLEAGRPVRTASSPKSLSKVTTSRPSRSASARTSAFPGLSRLSARPGWSWPGSRVHFVTGVHSPLRRLGMGQPKGCRQPSQARRHFRRSRECVPGRPVSFILVLIGMSLSLRLLVVVHAEKGNGEIVRLISARRATRPERKRYEEEG